ncbi:hypothetical protein BK125_20790 [Paenibacillus odorifer]|uniref:Uncharacterized protein n=1 Tax=Paenibacillus odorifer TaxID=189426 RepID=A0ABX3GDZ6_9BACL|nr:hypothetical protein [Paenibacillus odorifer]OMC74240.1 hypothetical protein BK125_20790 [Paenibacillus odorifer]OMD06304.1 hypothetical protein BSO21_30845 [Paenibacillus odorifer]
MSREKVQDEITAEVIEYIRELISYWESTDKSSLDKLNSLAFSILVALDGEADRIPSFIVAPLPHPDDKKFSVEKEVNYYPENHEVEEYIKGNIGGTLHEMFIRVKEHDVQNINAKSQRRQDEYHKMMVDDK